MKYYQKNMFFNYVYEFLLNLDFSRIIWPTYLILKGYNLIDVGICFIGAKIKKREGQ